MITVDLEKVLHARKRVPGIEQEILTGMHVKEAVHYADWVIRGRWLEAEPLILVDPESAARYAEKVLRQEWKEAEPVIVQSARAATRYASRVRRSRWLEAEPIIATSESAKYYARDVLAGRWDEKVAARCPCWLWLYAENECDGSLPEELHNRMIGHHLRNRDDPWVKQYFSTKKRPGRKSR